MLSTTRRRSILKVCGHSSRSGVAATEFAVALPLLMICLLGSIEVAHVIHLQQAITVAAYETAMSATSTKSTATGASSRGVAVLKAFQVEDAKIDVQPAVGPTTRPGTPIRVTVTAPTDTNAICPPWFIGGKVLRAEVLMIRL